VTFADTKDQVLAAFHFRRATKKFDPSRTIADDDVAYLLQVARMTPSSNGLEPWNILVLQDADLRRAIVDEADGPQQLLTAPLAIVLTAKSAQAIQPDSPFVAHMKLDVQGVDPDFFEQWRPHFGEFLANKLEIADSPRGLQDFGARQAYIVLGNLLTAAAMIGIDSCPLEGFIYSKAEKVLTDAGVLDTASDRIAVMAAFGYRAEEPKRPRTRRSLAEIVRYV
jgi:nitroreductase